MAPSSSRRLTPALSVSHPCARSRHSPRPCLCLIRALFRTTRLDQVVCTSSACLFAPTYPNVPGVLELARAAPSARRTRSRSAKAGATGTRAHVRAPATTPQWLPLLSRLTSNARDALLCLLSRVGQVHVELAGMRHVRPVLPARPTWVTPTCCARHDRGAKHHRGRDFDLDDDDGGRDLLSPYVPF